MRSGQTDTSLVEELRAADRAPLRLVVEEEGVAPRIIEHPRDASLDVGRGAEAAVRVDDPRVSQLHARLYWDGERLTLEDLGSANGTFVNGARAAGVVGVAPGAVITLGSTRIAVVPTRAPSPPPARPVAPPEEGSDLLAVDPATARVASLARRFAASDLSVLLAGETGSGKEVFARMIHRFSARAHGPFVAVNCGALPESLAESELFGHEKGAFTGALARAVGVFEAASGGTILLDEVGELSAANQTRLLRVLQEREVVRVGSRAPVKVDVRVLAATNRDLQSEVTRGRFREDLFFRLNAATLQIPALRERPRDLVPLVERFLAARGQPPGLGRGVMELLRAHRWPGNVRELKNAVDCACALAQGDEIQIEHLPPSLRGELATAASDGADGLRGRVEDLERRAIVAALDAAGWNQSRAARDLSISRRALLYKMGRFGIKPAPRRGAE